jgi:hypothetical protein
LGLFLLAAAGLKLAGQHVSPMPQTGWVSQPMVQLAAAEWEIVLGLWLLSGRFQAASWLAATGTFIFFAMVSGYQGTIGRVSCGCFGALAASPWHAFGLDIAVLLLLAVFRPTIGYLLDLSFQDYRRAILNCIFFGLGVGTLLLSFTLAGTLAFGSPNAAMARVRGQHITVEPAYLDVGTGTAGNTTEATVRVHNYSDHPIRLVGGVAD